MNKKNTTIEVKGITIAGLTSFVLSSGKWIEQTNAVEELKVENDLREWWKYEQ